MRTTPSSVQARVEEMLRSGDPWSLSDGLAEAWSEALAQAVEARFTGGTEEDRKRLIWLLGAVRVGDPTEILLRWLSRTEGVEAGRVLSVLNARRRPVPAREIRRLLASAPQEAVVAAGLSGDPSLAVELEALLAEPGVGRHAALALAQLGQRHTTLSIVRRMAGASARDVAGFAVALETLQDTRAVPELLRLLEAPGTRGDWDIHHALCRLCDREPLVALDGGAEAIVAAWRAFDPTAPRAPRLTIDADPAASFTLHDGAGRVRVDYLPPTPGSMWSRWSLGLFVGDTPLYGVGSRCGTCETTLHLLGVPTERAMALAGDVRRRLADVVRLDAELLHGLAPHLGLLHSGHYLAFLRDVDLELVEAPAASWLTRRHAHRTSADTPSPEDRSVDEVDWPGIAHFQTRTGPRGAPPTYGVVLPSEPLSALDEATIDGHAARIAEGRHPTALLTGWVEHKYVCAEIPERFLILVVLDGHHTLAAYARLGRPARCLLVCRLEDSWGPPGDRGAELREAVVQLSAAVEPPRPG